MGRSAARQAIGDQQIIIVLEARQSARIAGLGEAQQIDDRLFFGLAPDTLAVEKTGESDLDLERAPGQYENQTNDSHQPIGQWPQAL
jgi:hypothetical protein